MSMLLSLVAAVLLLVPTAAVLVGVAVSGRRDRAWARSVAEVLAEFRAHAAARAAGPPEDGPGGGPGGPDGPGTPAAPAPEPPPARLAQVIAFPGAARAGSGDGSAGGPGSRRAA